MIKVNKNKVLNIHRNCALMTQGVCGADLERGKKSARGTGQVAMMTRALQE